MLATWNTPCASTFSICCSTSIFGARSSAPSVASSSTIRPFCCGSITPAGARNSTQWTTASFRWSRAHRAIRMRRRAAATAKWRLSCICELFLRFIQRENTHICNYIQYMHEQHCVCFIRANESCSLFCVCLSIWRSLNIVWFRIHVTHIKLPLTTNTHTNARLSQSAQIQSTSLFGSSGPL